MSSLLAVLVFAGLVNGSSWSGSSLNSSRRELDLSRFHYPAAVMDAIRSHIPPEVRDSLIDNIDPEAYGNYIGVYLFLPVAHSEKDTSLLLLYNTGWLTKPALQYFRRTGTNWRLINQIRELSCEGPSSLMFHDIDCDGGVEIFLQSAVGARGYSALNVLGIKSDTLALLDSILLGTNDLRALSIDVDSVGDCQWEIAVGKEDRSFSRRTETIDIFRYDRMSHQFKLAFTIPYAEERRCLSGLACGAYVAMLLRGNIDPEVLKSLLAVADSESVHRFVDFSTNNSNTLAPADSNLFASIHLGHGNSTLMYFACDKGRWRFVNQLRRLNTEQMPTFDYLDIDCDGHLEIIVRSAVGVHTAERLEIFGVTADTLVDLTTELFPKANLVGQPIEFRRLGDCDWELHISEPGSGPYYKSGPTEVYRLDAATHTFQPIEVEPKSKE